MAFSLEDFDHISEFRQGGTAKVYIATQKSLNRKVVIKEMTCGPAEESVQQKRFENEAKAAAALDHDNIIRIYDFGEKGASYYITMEYVDGPDFEDLLHTPGFPVRTGLAVVLQALKGIRYSHQHATVHRDIKPANILISRNGRVKVADFGLAHAGHRSTALTASGMMVGTPQYMSPEQVNGSRVKDPRMDVWAAGVLLYRVLTGKHPFEGVSLPAMVYSVVYTKEKNIKEALPELPDGLAANITLCLEKDPGKRLPSLDPLIESLQEYLFSLGVRDPAEEIARHPAVRAAEPAPAAPSLEVTTTRAPAAKAASFEKTVAAAPASGPDKSGRHRTALLAVLAIGLMVIAGIALAFALRIGRSAVGLSQSLDKRPETVGADPVRDIPSDFDKEEPATVPDAPTPTPAPLRDLREKAPVKAAPPEQKPVVAHQPVPEPTPSANSATAPQLPPKTTAQQTGLGDVSPVRERAATTGELHIMTFPSRVDILIDGISQGMTPLREPLRLAAGKHELILRKNGYTEHRETIVIGKNALKRVRARLEKEGSAR